MRILDANLLIYAFDSLSPFHSVTNEWLKKIYREDNLVGIPRQTILAFLRITTNPRAMNIALTVEESLACISQLLEHPKTAIPEPKSEHHELFSEVVKKSGAWGPLITDAYLATLAMEYGAILCSHDRDFMRFEGLQFENPLS